MKPLYTKKNGTSQRVAAIEVKMPASYPSANVTYGSGSVEDALDELNRGSVSVTTDGVKTWPQLFDSLFALVDSSKVSEHTCLKLAYSTNSYEVYFPVWISKGTQYIFARHYYSSGNSYTVTIEMQSSGSSYTNNGSPYTSVPSAGTIISIIY